MIDVNSTKHFQNARRTLIVVKASNMATTLSTVNPFQYR